MYDIICERQHSLGNVKLSGKRVYGADGWAVRELLKAGRLLHAALRAPAPSSDDLRPHSALLSYDVTAKVTDILNLLTWFWYRLCGYIFFKFNVTVAVYANITDR